MTVGQVAAAISTSVISEGGTEAAQHGWQNYVAKELAKYHPTRALDDQVINSLIVGAVVICFPLYLTFIASTYTAEEIVSAAPMPLLLSHGWPGSVFEFLDLIPRLTDPARFGGDPADAFTVVAPSLPGYGLSYVPGQPRFAVDDIATTFHALMTEVLGYPRFGAQGGDWGCFVTSILAAEHPEALTGIHLNMLPLRRDREMATNPTPEEAQYLKALAHFLKEETGYQWIQGTRPQTLAHALADSPSGLAAWIFEKFHAWTDCDGDPERAVPLDTMLANISLYWFTGAIGSSFWPYYARMHAPWPVRDGSIGVPTGYADFPREILRPPRSMAARVYTDIRRWTVMPRGGHFAALEQPEALVAEIQAFFRPLR
jgi:microsomal epoxide hydrolase